MLSNRAYNPIESNEAINYLVDKLKGPSMTEGAIWGASLTMGGAALYSAGNELARGVDINKVSQKSPFLGEVVRSWQNMGDSADKVISGEKGFSHLMRSGVAEGVKWKSGAPIASAAAEMAARNANVDPEKIARLRGNLDAINNHLSGVTDLADLVVGPETDMKNRPKASTKVEQHVREAQDFAGRSAARNLFGTGWKNNALRVGAAAIPGAITGALHNASNGIASPY